MKLQYMGELILKGLSLLSRASWTTVTTKQGHAPSSGLMRLHKQYGKLMMQDRAILVSAAAFSGSWPGRRTRWRGLRGGSRATYVSGRQVLLRDLHSTAERLKLGGKQFKPGLAGNLMNDHVQHWRNMSAESGVLSGSAPASSESRGMTS